MTGTLEGVAGVGHAVDATLHLVVDLRLFGVAEVEAIGDGDDLGADAGEVAGRLHDGDGAAGVGVEVAEAPVAVGGEGEALAASP